MYVIKGAGKVVSRGKDVDAIVAADFDHAGRKLGWKVEDDGGGDDGCDDDHE